MWLCVGCQIADQSQYAREMQKTIPIMDMKRIEREKIRNVDRN